VEIELPFDELSRRATAGLSGEIAGKGITVGTVAVWGVGDTVVVKVALEGKVSGALYLVGRVAYDPAPQVLLIEDLRYTIESNSKLSSIKATLGANSIRNALDSAANYGSLPIGAQLDRFKTQLGVQLNRELAPGVSLTGGVTDVRIAGISATQAAFVLRVVFEGQAAIAIR
jgi:hypothetical protein